MRIKVMDDVELRTLVLETAREVGIAGKTGADLAPDVLARMSPAQKSAALLLLGFEDYVQDVVDAALDFLKARLN